MVQRTFEASHSAFDFIGLLDGARTWYLRGLPYDELRQIFEKPGAVAIRIHLVLDRLHGGLLLLRRKVGCCDTCESRPRRTEIGKLEAEYLSLDVSLESGIDELLEEGRGISEGAWPHPPRSAEARQTGRRFAGT